ncbi:MAG: DinB family protein [Streptosporangiales bacterium]|nr:DinB family protein [Streptosporangiales bacterium]MBO0889569.1 DinB family protein [Acidothermales bacterium]
MATNTAELPPLAGEDHRCDDCGMSYPDLTVADADRLLAGIPERAGAALRGVQDQRLRTRPDADTWSIAEYACHLRDVYLSFTIRLHRVRTEDAPAFEPMFNDLRARRFRYRQADVDAVLDELAAYVAGFRAEIARVADDEWGRVGSRLPGEVRTARWLVRQAAHEGVHHIGDIAAIAGRE